MLNWFGKSKNVLTVDQKTHYLQLCEEVSAILLKYNKRIHPYGDNSLARLQSHSNPLRVIEVLEQYFNVLRDADQAGEDLNDSKQLLWRMIKILGAAPTSDIFDLISDDHVVEIYTSDNWQIFRNLKFFDYVSFSVDELATFNWKSDTRRSMSVTIKALQLVSQVKLGLLKNTMSGECLGSHFAKEKIGKKWLIQINVEKISPLLKSSGRGMYVLLNRCKLLSSSSGSSRLRVGDDALNRY